MTPRVASDSHGGLVRVSSIVTLLFALAVMTVAPRVTADYSIVDLGTLGTDARSGALGINERGQVVGWSSNDRLGDHAFVWENGTMRDLRGPSGDGTWAWDINEAGQIVGERGNEFTRQGLLWDKGTFMDVGSSTSALAINDRGQIVGLAAGHAVLWEDGTTKDLGTLGGPYSEANAINDKGQVVGVSTYSDNWDLHAFLWQDGVMSDLGTLGGEESYARDINDVGQIVGSSYTATGLHAFLWENGVMTDLGTLGSKYSEARGINDAGQIVGYSGPMGQEYAVLWENGGIRNLGALPGGESRAEDINEAGQVIGMSSRSGASIHAVLWNVAPRVVHDVAATAADAYPRSVVVGSSVQVVGDVQNQGTQQETFDVTIYVGASPVGTKRSTSLSPQASLRIEFTWNTTGVEPGTYRITVVATPLAGESDIGDNEYVGPTLEVQPSAQTSAPRPVLDGWFIVGALGFVTVAGGFAVAIVLYSLRRKSPKR